MPISKRRTVPKRRIKRRLKPHLPTKEEVSRMAELIAAGHGGEKEAQVYFNYVYGHQLARLQSIVAKAEAERTWGFMHGSLMQATDLYVLASVLYEKYPEHVIMSDGAFDGLARFLLKHFDKLPKDFTDWYAITAIDLEAGTGSKVLAQKNIRWMVHIITGEWMEEEDGAETHDRSRILRRGKAKRRSVRTTRFKRRKP